MHILGEREGLLGKPSARRGEPGRAPDTRASCSIPQAVHNGSRSVLQFTLTRHSAHPSCVLLRERIHTSALCRSCRGAEGCSCLNAGPRVRCWNIKESSWF